MQNIPTVTFIYFYLYSPTNQGIFFLFQIFTRSRGRNARGSTSNSDTFAINNIFSSACTFDGNFLRMRGGFFGIDFGNDKFREKKEEDIKEAKQSIKIYKINPTRDETFKKYYQLNGVALHVSGRIFSSSSLRRITRKIYIKKGQEKQYVYKTILYEIKTKTKN